VLGVVALDKLAASLPWMLPSAQATRRASSVPSARLRVTSSAPAARPDRAVALDRDAGGGEGVVERRGQVAGGHHVAHRRQAVVGGRQQAAAEAALLGDVDGLDGRGLQLRPDAEPLEGQPAAVGEGQHAGVVAGGAAGGRPPAGCRGRNP
jgi:hypothetical protein